MNSEASTVNFPCQSCGGQMMFDTASQNLKCGYCGREETIENIMTEPQEHSLDFAELEQAATMDWGTEQQALSCSNCGGQMLLNNLQTAIICPFCGSPKVLPQNNAESSIRPESIVPFRISRDQAISSFLAWKRKRWFAPNQFKKQNVDSSLNGIYIPHWTYDADSSSAYTAEVGTYHYRSETRTRTVNGKTETYTEQVRYTVWHHTSGTYSRFFDDVLIPASGQYDEKLLGRLGGFNLKSLSAYKPQYISGFIAERYSVSLGQGWDQAINVMDDKINGDVRRQIGGDELRNLNIRTHYSDATYKHILLPIWNAIYTYQNKQFRYMVNGETGTVSGKAPKSAWKITFFTLFCVAAVILLVYFISQSQ